ncbi:MAG TPA: hypothetical protein VMQ86_23575 [Bryobacteraceae bacterium]|jgi:hypothetical protein|nr:hypothetical protein [Bryobacteraceae bacterium]
MKARVVTRTVRRSVALPRTLVEEAAVVAPADLQGNLNRLLPVALRELVERRKARAFRRAMAAMASDPAIQAENAAIARKFAAAEGDGLPHLAPI